MNFATFKKKLIFWRQPEIQFSGRTDTGRRRAANEDSFAVLPRLSLMMVADGIGGHKAGEVASRRAVEIMIDLLSPSALREVRGNREGIKHLLISSLCRVNDRIMAMAADNEDLSGMGTTFIVALIDNGSLYTCHVGDVRAYIAGQNGLRQVTNDHSYAAEFKRRETEATEQIAPPARNIVSRAVGFPFREDPECHCLPLSPRERITICSDGLWSMVSDEKMAAIISQAVNPDTACAEYIRAANENGGKDNITAVVAYT
ncbi:Protein serine/threonine phosphatase PrpC, regulation of stationary phase [hydrothermal vent metagenome]|uniref:Protein serine/threonine phosphatase PrpC, regulation of stationary phase n=1 Tax=hydrothermal vent metagenome TaxID=652676 RepID=A0A3B0V6I3_9ZZZZ